MYAIPFYPFRRNKITLQFFALDTVATNKISLFKKKERKKEAFCRKSNKQNTKSGQGVHRGELK